MCAKKGWITGSPIGYHQSGGAVSSRVTDFRSHQVVLRVDFDLLDDDGRARVSMRFQMGPGVPDPGDLVYLLDGEGRGCVGEVEDATGWYVLVRPEWSTWVGRPQPSAIAS
jgi:hypothetical protein